MQNAKGFFKNKRNKKTIFAIGACIVFVVTGGCALWEVGSHTLAVTDILPDKTPSSTYVEVSFAEEYPFASAADNAEQDASPAADAGLTERITEKVDFLKEGINSYASNNNPLSQAYYRLFGFSQKVLGKDLIKDSEKDVYRLENGKLVYLERWESTPTNYANVTDFTDFLKERDTDFLYIFPLSIADDESISFPSGLETGYAQTHREFMNWLTGHGVTVFDAKPYLLSLDNNFFNWVYRTDHHWNVRAGLSAAQQTLRIMREDFEYNVDPSVCDLSRYRSVVYPSSLIGSLGGKSTMGYTDPEDFEVLYPTFNTRFHIEIPTQAFNETDCFENTMIDKSFISLADNAYVAFLKGNHPLIRIHNENCSNGVRVLMLKHSNANVVIPYLACAVEYVDVIDPRYFDGSMRTYVEKNDPDIVMICAAGALSDEDENWTFK